MLHKTFSFLLLSLLLFSFPLSQTFATTQTVLIDAVQTTGGAGHTNDEFIRLTNLAATAIDLTGFRLTKKYLSGQTCKESTLVSTSHFTGTLSPLGTFTIAHPSYRDSIHADLDYSSSLYYLPDAVTVILYGKDGNILDQKIIGKDCETLIPPKETDIPPVPSLPTPHTYSSSVRINEILANPSGPEEKEEFIELYNPTDDDVDLSLWSLKDMSATGKYIFPLETTVPTKHFFTIYRPTFDFALNNSNETLFLLDPNGETRDTVTYKTAKEDISFNYTSSGWRGGTPTPDAPNHTNALPETKEKIPRKGYKNVALSFDARGKDEEGDSLKYTWNFGDGHKSYKEKTTHTYKDNGTYIVTLKTSDGKDDVEETFSLIVQSFPHPTVRIIAILPNPTGIDTTHEWVLIENREKKKINLKGYSIATGWKKLSNHPIREDFFIQAKKQALLFNTISLFTLPNQKGKIELRAPDGKTLQKIQYKLDAPLKDERIYRKEKGSAWQWDIPKTPLPITTTSSVKQSDTVENNIPLTIPEQKINILSEDKETNEVLLETAPKTTPLIATDPHRPKPQDILTYGTSLHLSQSFILTTPTDHTPLLSSTPEETFLFPADLSFIQKINMLINTFLNND